MDGQFFHSPANTSGMGIGKLRKTHAAQHAVIMIGHTFAAEKMPADRTADHGLAPGVVKTTVLDRCIGHRWIVSGSKRRSLQKAAAPDSPIMIAMAAKPPDRAVIKG